MPTSNFKLFDENKANMLSDQEYETNNQRLNGVQQGIASSQLQNKTMYQVALMTYAIAQLMVQNGVDASDQAAVSAFVDNLNKTLVQKVKDKASESEATAGINNEKFITPVTLWKALEAFNTSSFVLKKVFTTSGVYEPTPGKVKCVIVAVGFGGDGGTTPAHTTDDNYRICSGTGGGGGGATVVTEATLIRSLPSNKNIVIDRSSKTVNVFGGYITAAKGGNGGDAVVKVASGSTEVNTKKSNKGYGGSGSTKPAGAIETKGGNGGSGGVSYYHPSYAPDFTIEGEDGGKSTDTIVGSISISIGTGGGGGAGCCYQSVADISSENYTSGDGGRCGGYGGGNGILVRKDGKYNSAGSPGGSGATYDSYGKNVFLSSIGSDVYTAYSSVSVPNLIGAGAGGNGGVLFYTKASGSTIKAVPGAEGGTGAVFIYENA